MQRPSAAAGTDAMLSASGSKKQSTDDTFAADLSSSTPRVRRGAVETSQRLSLLFKTEVKPSAADGGAALTPRVYIYAGDKQNEYSRFRRPRQIKHDVFERLYNDVA